MKINIMTLVAAVTFSVMSPLALAEGGYGSTSIEDENDRGTMIERAESHQRGPGASPMPEQPTTPHEDASGGMQGTPGVGQPDDVDAQRRQMEQRERERNQDGIDQRGYYEEQPMPIE